MIVIVDYGMGNLASIANMLKKAGVPAMISSTPETIENAVGLILPGVGAFDAGMENLVGRGLVDPLRRAVLDRSTPILGLCLGMQLMTRRSAEGRVPGLAWFDAETVRFDVSGRSDDLKVPHMGWNTIRFCKESPLREDLDASSRFYFVHSFHVVCSAQEDVLGWTRYGYEFASAIARGNIMGVQFHPEKSHRFGLQLLRNFAASVPRAAA